MKKLCFAIPTWNRAKKLERCVREMARQIIELGRQDEIGIFVSDNRSDDDTPQVLAKLKRQYSFLDYCRLDKHTDARYNFESVCRNAPGEFLWIFGDDDTLLKDGLRLVWHVLNTKEAVIIHAGNGWLKPHSYKIYEGTVLEFANKMGFNQFIGWITAIVIKKEIIRQMMELREWDKYTEASFSHALGILHVATHEPAVVIDFPICEPMEPQTKEDIKRWEQENIGWRYFITVEGLQILFQLGILKEKLNPLFFKYLNYYLWDRFITNMIATELVGKPFPSKGWDLILAMADMIDDIEMAKNIRNCVITSYQLCNTRNILLNQITAINTILKGVIDEANIPIFEPGWAGGQK
ncbi:glycosyltransferase family 2 protein [Thermodesulfovibrio thiophilus]|uniref:glycosyltransferase family 2 protein n=1 Tax=Thermodesulfovibrio thiophilus TaxID=340095 RepID=UPI0017AB9E82|nr:glycosyltransferase [Thermodesulfovibrio thiophilus]HHW21220.1 glycosyltransferase [Thermodesulfovibrio thiophilus]